MNELGELYDSLSVLYDSLPNDTHSEWKSALRSVLHGGNLLAEDATCYGKQQKERNRGKRKEYVQKYGNGERITEFSEITVSEPRPEGRRFVPSGAVLPVAPISGTVLPVKVSSDNIDDAISLLAEFPAEPAADSPGEGNDVLLDPVRVRQASMASGIGSVDETSILFVSDTHFGYKNRVKTGRGNTVPWVHEISSERVLNRLVKLAYDRDVDAIIHAGDILDHEVDRGTLEPFETSLEALSLFGIPLYYIIGSHDHNSWNHQHQDSVDGIAWLKRQTRNGNLTELSTTPTAVADGPLDAYGISSGNVGTADVGSFNSRDWAPEDIHFGSPRTGPNLLCLHDGVTPYRNVNFDVDLDRLLSRVEFSFDCVLIGDEHNPKNGDFENGFRFNATDGTPVFYTGPAMRISRSYQDHNPFVTELTISDNTVTAVRHTL